jgi:hypothetical protein
MYLKKHLEGIKGKFLLDYKYVLVVILKSQVFGSWFTVLIPL